MHMWWIPPQSPGMSCLLDYFLAPFHYCIVSLPRLPDIPCAECVLWLVFQFCFLLFKSHLSFYFLKANTVTKQWHILNSLAIQSLLTENTFIVVYEQKVIEYAIW